MLFNRCKHAPDQISIGAFPSRSLEKVVALIPAHNEQDFIARTIEGILQQTRRPDLTVVICDNCTDDTYAIASSFDVLAVQTINNTNKKSGALSWAWKIFAQDADLVVFADADTFLAPNAVEDWVEEFRSNPTLGGSSAKFTMNRFEPIRPTSFQGTNFLFEKSKNSDFRKGSKLPTSVQTIKETLAIKFYYYFAAILVRLQIAEFARWTSTGLQRGWTSVLAGTACAIRNSLLKEVGNRQDREGPWSYHSQVEDFELTYRIRELGYLCVISPTVRAYTDAMKTIPSLWAQRMKWQVGTVEDLITLGVNRLTLLDWYQQLLGLFAAITRVVWVILLLLAMTPYGSLSENPIWFIISSVFILSDTIQSFLIPNRDKKDTLLAILLIPQELFAWLRALWFAVSWFEVLVGRMTNKRKDHWSIQYVAEKEKI